MTQKIHLKNYFFSACFMLVSALLVSCGSTPPTGPGTKTYSISGRITPAVAEDVSGVIVTVGGFADTTAADGQWSIAGVDTGSVTITPKKATYAFAPATRVVVVKDSNVTGQDFVATQPTAVEPHPVMIAVDPGTFLMGGGSGVVSGGNRARPRHQVTLTKGFHVAKTETTQEQFESVMGINFSRDKHPKSPVTNVTLLEIMEYCNRLSTAEGLVKAYSINGTAFTWDQNASGYRLPTEAEWEYSARAGDTTSLTNGDHTQGATSDLLDQVAWYQRNTGTPPSYKDAKVQPVGQKLPNKWGLYDVIGNAYEAVIDRFTDYLPEPQIDPLFITDGSTVVYRGGAIVLQADDISLSGRVSGPLVREAFSVGFRLVRNK